MKFTIACLIFCFTFATTAQDYKFGDVSDEEVQNNTYANDSLAEAVYLIKHRESYFDHQPPDGWVLVTEIHQRIKILNKEGLEYGTKKVAAYRNGSSKERITKIKAYTYNDEGGKISREKLRNSGIFETELSDQWEETSMAFPNVKVGSVIDLTYKITSPFWKIDDLIIQEDIPVKEYYAEISALNFIKYKRQAKGGFQIDSKNFNRGRNISYSYEQKVNKALTESTQSANLVIDEFVNEYHFKNVPALREEAYVDNIDNYRYAVSYELSATDWPGNGLKQYSSTWDKVAETIYKSDGFGKQLKGNKFMADDVASLINGSNSQLEHMNAIFNFVKNKMTWNGKERNRSINGLRRAYKDNTGNVTDINLILVSMLQQAGLDTTPVLVSTRDHGIPLFPTIEGFNYTIAATKINDEIYLMDATEKLSTPNLLPTRVLNWEGTMVRGDGSTRKISLYPTEISQQNTLLNINLNPDGSATGKQKNNFTSLEAFNFRKRNSNVSSTQRAERIEAETNLTVSNLQNEGMEDLAGSVTENFDLEIETAAESIGNKLYINPLLHLALNKNPFVLEERSYPIDYTYPSLNRKIISITIPEGYQVESLPEPVSIAMPNGVGSFKYNVSEVQGVLSVRSSFTINTSIVPATMYASIKEFYNQRVLKENEKVVLSKI